jgi:hypothetical protein
MNIKELDNTTSMNEQINENILSEMNLSIIVDEIVDFIFKEINKSGHNVKQHVFDYLNNYNINSNEIYNFLLNNEIIQIPFFCLDFLIIMELKQL